MSLDVLTAIWRDPPCKGGDLLCLLAIADNADENGYAWPSVSTIARKAAMGERGAQKCIKKLADAQLISIKSGGGRNKTNAYQITTNGIGEGRKRQNPEQNTPPPSSPFTDVNPERCDINPEPAFAKPRTPVHPNSQEPPIEPSVDDNAGAKAVPISEPDPPPKKMRLPEGWVPDGEDLEYALSQKLNHAEIEEIANDFHTYWRDRTDAGGRKSARGWRQTWRNRVRDQAPKFIRNRRMAGDQHSGGYGQGGGIAGVVARRQFGG